MQVKWTKSKLAEGWQNNLCEEVQAEVANQRKLYAIVEQRMKRGRIIGECITSWVMWAMPGQL